MIKDITIGQFFPGNSVIHKLDPRIKLVLTFVYIVIVFLCKNFVSLASIVVALTVVILLSKISPKLIWKSENRYLLLLLLRRFYRFSTIKTELCFLQSVNFRYIPAGFIWLFLLRYELYVLL